jgi:transcriptional regulator with XRE-family HTH domain
MSQTDAGVPTLADLIRDHQDRTGDSFGDIARRTGLSKAKIGQLARPENTYLVRQETLHKLARGLSLPLATVERASLGTAGFADRDVQQADRVHRIAERLAEFDDDTLRLIADLVEVLGKHLGASK